MVYYELWDTATRNLVEDYPDRDRALLALREIDNLEGLALAEREDNGHTRWIARDEELTTLAESHAVLGR